jgi:hypothetical protein
VGVVVEVQAGTEELRIHQTGIMVEEEAVEGEEAEAILGVETIIGGVVAEEVEAGGIEGEGVGRLGIGVLMMLVTGGEWGGWMGRVRG